MPELFVIDSGWSAQTWVSTGGTRAKKYLQSPTGEFYYFKRSQYKDPTPTKLGKNYKYEFWSEVIAYGLGNSLGFDVLKYDIAIDGEIMGCISQSMIDRNKEELNEGAKYLVAFSPDYDPSSKSQQNWYTFQLIEDALQNAKLGGEIEHILRMIVFDSLIGNGDRHQENWAIISRQLLIPDYIDYLEKSRGVRLTAIDRFLQRFMRMIFNKMNKKKYPRLFYETERRFAPIYDSGSSLGRELVEHKVTDLLNSDDELNKYIDRGPSEIHWEGVKLNHFELIRKLFRTRHKEEVIRIIKKVLYRWDQVKIEKMVTEIDNNVPESHKSYKIPQDRKNLIIKMITLRKNRLKDLIHDGI